MRYITPNCVESYRNKGKSPHVARIVTEAWLWDLIIQALNLIYKQIRTWKEPQVRSTPPHTGIQSSEAYKNRYYITCGTYLNIRKYYSDHCKHAITSADFSGPNPILSPRLVRHSLHQASQINSSGKYEPLNCDAWRGLCLTGRGDRV
jgi:hypothetical protein